jgi:amino-acid N-acetyltransferase
VASKPRFMVLSEEGRIVGAGALQRFGSSALIRSVVVSEDRRGSGLGRIIVQELESYARATRIDQLILLTETAREFFSRQGYHVIERSDAPREIQGSEEFRALCPASATCMLKVVTE